MEDLAKWLREQIGADERVAHASPVWAEWRSQCEAHRKIVDAYTSLGDAPSNTYGIEIVRTELGAVLMFLALAYQHRPGYRPEWRA